MNEQAKLPAAWSDWQLTELIGTGSYGSVYKALNANNGGREAAVKIIHIPGNEAEASALQYEYPDLTERTDYCTNLVQNVLNEIRAMEILKDHPNIVTIYDSHVDHEEGSMEWTVYIMMELLTSLPDHLLTHQLSEDDIIKLGTDLLRGLEGCQKNGILHRDIKPENIMVAKDGSFKLGDFGLARQLSSASMSLSLRGTFTYMAPEVYHGSKYNAKADCYSLALVMYRLLNRNRDPFIDPDSKMVYYKDREDAFVRRMSGDEIPAPKDASPALWQVLKKSCAYKPEDRFPDVAFFLTALKQCNRKPSAAAAHEKGRHRFLPFTLLAGSLCAVGLAFFFAISSDTPKKPSSADSATAATASTAAANTTTTSTSLSGTVQQQAAQLQKSALWGFFAVNDKHLSTLHLSYLDVATDAGARNISDVPYSFGVFPNIDENVIVMVFEDKLQEKQVIYGSYRLQNQELTVYPTDKSSKFADQFKDAFGDEMTLCRLLGKLTFPFTYENGAGAPVIQNASGVEYTYCNTCDLSSTSRHRMQGVLSGEAAFDDIQGIVVTSDQIGSISDSANSKTSLSVTFTDGRRTTDGTLESYAPTNGVIYGSSHHVDLIYNGKEATLEEAHTFRLKTINCYPYGFIMYDEESDSYFYYQDYERLSDLPGAELPEGWF